MDLHSLARGSGLLGGLCWLVRLVLDVTDSGSVGLADGLYWTGFVLLGLALVAMGAGLVSGSAGWLRALVAVAFPLLVWSVLEVLHPEGDPEGVDGVFGALAVVVAAAGLVRAGSQREPRSPSAGAHAR